MAALGGMTTRRNRKRLPEEDYPTYHQYIHNEAVRELVEEPQNGIAS